MSSPHRVPQTHLVDTGWGTCREGDNNLFCASSAPWPIMNAVRGVVLHIIVFSPEVGPVIIPVLQRRMLRFKEKECNLLKATQLTLGSRLSDSIVLKLPLMNSTAVTSQASHFLYSDSCPLTTPPPKDIYLIGRPEARDFRLVLRSNNLIKCLVCFHLSWMVFFFFGSFKIYF